MSLLDLPVLLLAAAVRGDRAELARLDHAAAIVLTHPQAFVRRYEFEAAQEPALKREARTRVQKKLTVALKHTRALRRLCSPGGSAS